MKQWIMLLLFFAASISIVACEEREAGKASFDMGDGYEASFVLSDIGTPYLLDYLYDDGIAENELLGYKSYGFTISSNGTDLALVSMNVWTSPQFLLIPTAGIEESSVPEIGPRIITHKTISDASGYVGYDLRVGAAGTDTSNAMTGFFKCFSGAFKDANDLKGTIEIYGEVGDSPVSAQSLQVFNSLVDSIKITGPGI